MKNLTGEQYILNQETMKIPRHRTVTATHYRTEQAGSAQDSSTDSTRYAFVATDACPVVVIPFATVGGVVGSCGPPQAPGQVSSRSRTQPRRADRLVLASFSTRPVASDMMVADSPESSRTMYGPALFGADHPPLRGLLTTTNDPFCSAVSGFTRA